MSGDFWTYMGTYSGRSGPPPPSVRPRALPVQARTSRGRRNYSPQQARLIMGIGLAVIAFCIACGQIHSTPPPAPSYGSSTSGPAQMYPHNPALGAAVIGGEAKAVGHVARFAGRTAFRGTIMRGIGRGFGGGTYTPGGTGFHGFGFFGF